MPYFKNRKEQAAGLSRFCVLFFWLMSGTASLFAQTDQQANAMYQKAAKETAPAKCIASTKDALVRARSVSDRITEVKCINLIAGQYLQQKQPDTAITFVRQALLIPANYRPPLTTGDLYMILGMAEHQKGRYITAKQAYSQAANYYKSGRDELSEAIAYLNIGICEKQLANYREAITHYLHASSVFVALKDSSYLATAYNSVALCFVSLKEYPKAVSYNKVTLSIRQKFKDAHGITQSLNNLGFAFNGAGQPDSALLYLRPCITLRAKVGDSAGLVLPLQNMGHALRLKGNWKASERYVLRSVALSQQYKLPEEEAKADLDLATIYSHDGRYGQAFKEVDKTIRAARQLKLPELLIDAYGLQAELYFKTGNIQHALTLTRLQASIKDSVFTSEKDRYINGLEVQYQTEQRQKDIAALHLSNALQNKIVLQQRHSIITLIVISLLLLLLFFIAIYNYRLKIKAYRQIKTLMKDLHHRVKNNLQLLSGLFTMQMETSTDELTKNALQQNDSRLSAMNLIHKQLYIEDPTMRIDMCAYLTELANYVKSAFGNQQITLLLELEQVFVSADQAIAIGLIVNELVTNSFKYAFGASVGTITIGLACPGRGITKLYVADNGKGMPADENCNSGSFGLNLVKIMAAQLAADVTIKHDSGLAYEFVFSQ